MKKISKSSFRLFKNVLFLNACFFAFSAILMQACTGDAVNITAEDRKPVITPDYSDITIPLNIAPLNFLIDEQGEKYKVEIYSADREKIVIKSAGNDIRIPLKRWKKLLLSSAGKDIFFEICVKKNGNWIKYNIIVNHVADDPIDSYVVYRLIDPGFEMWSKMGIYQRCLENFEEKPVMLNSLSRNNCMNCHSFSGNDSRTMLFHMRGNLAGTIIYRNGEIKKTDTKTDEILSAGVYPAWHPDGRFVAFSVNNITQLFHAVPEKKIEVIDSQSDLILFDMEANTVSQCESIASEERLETFPTWSPDGRYLYYCSAEALPVSQYDERKYGLFRISFDPETQKFGETDTVLSPARTGMSISFPGVSPDGRYIIFCMSQYGNFTIWHSDSDLYMLDTENGEMKKLNINSDQAESYHSWTSNGRWIVFGSRRSDGLFTRLWLSYFSRSGETGKPFIVPQKNPTHYDTFFKSYNRPEFITTKLDLNPRILSKYAGLEPEKASFRTGKSSIREPE